MDETIDYLSNPPNDITIIYLDNLIDNSSDINEFNKKSNRKLLRVMFWMGEILKYNGVDELIIRKRLPTYASSIKLSTKPWEFANKKIEYILSNYIK
jgi:hypothetical protein